MTCGQAPLTILFHERIRELHNDVDWFAFSAAFHFRLPGHHCRVVAIKPRFHVVVLENIVMNFAGLRVFDVVSGGADLALRVRERVIVGQKVRDLVGIAIQIRRTAVAFGLKNGGGFVAGRLRENGHSAILSGKM
jgi:hypothetical protein